MNKDLLFSQIIVLTKIKEIVTKKSKVFDINTLKFDLKCKFSNFLLMSSRLKLHFFKRKEKEIF